MRQTVRVPYAEATGSLTVAVCGNPNAGKTTLFNVLTGLSHKVANYPGVTVEKLTGTFRLGSRTCQLIDIPGAYSLAARSPDELIATEALSGRVAGEPKPDVVVVVVDSTKLERGLYLVSQVQELGIPVVVALNMYDVAQRRGIRIDQRRLSSELGAPVVPMVAKRGEGISLLKDAVARMAGAQVSPPGIVWPDELLEAIERIRAAANGDGFDPISPGEAARLLFDEQSPADIRIVRERGRHFVHLLESERRALASLGGPALETDLRTRHVAAVASRVAERPGDPDASLTSRFDRILLHRLLGPVIMAAMMILVFQAIFSWAQPVMGLVDLLVVDFGSVVRSAMPEGPLRSLLADGIIGGAGSVLVFLPQILILFFFIGVLEDTGYMPRAAFLADRLFRGCGLTGRSLIPLLSSFACAVPGIMATRTIDQRSQRFLTIVVAPLMTCSARLPVYAILIAAFIPPVTVLGVFNVQGLTLAALYVLGLAVAAIVALILKHTWLRGAVGSFVLELPTYRLPNWPNIFIQMYLRGRTFVTRAGTVILALTVVLWALSYYPRVSTGARENVAPAQAESAVRDAGAAASVPAVEQLKQSYLGRVGRWLEPATQHLGWDWRITVAVLASFPAREVVIATLGTIFNLGAEAADDASTLIQKMRQARWDHGPRQGEPIFGIPSALSVMVFFALCCQCMATLATIKRETNSYRWPVIVFGYMTILATTGAFAVYRLSLAFGAGGVS